MGHYKQIVINVDGSRKLTLRNRRFVNELDPRKTGLGNHPPVARTTAPKTPGPGRMRNYAVTPPSWSLLSSRQSRRHSPHHQKQLTNEQRTRRRHLLKFCSLPGMKAVLTSVIARKMTRYMMSLSRRPHWSTTQKHGPSSVRRNQT